MTPHAQESYFLD